MLRQSLVIWCQPMDRFADRLPVPASYFELVLRQFGTTGFLRDQLLAGTGVGVEKLSEPGAEITLGQQLQQLRNLNRLLPGGWALSVGASFHASTHGPLGFAAVSAATLGDALDLVARFFQVRHPSHRANGELVGGEYRLALTAQTALLDEERLPIAEIFLLSVQTLIEAILARPFSDGRFELDYPAPAWAHLYPRVFHAEIRFAAPRTALIVPAALLGLHSPLADPMTIAAALPTLEALARRIDGLDFTAARVEQLLTQAGDTSLPLADSAKRIGLSRRSLIRRLHEAGTSYRELRDLHRMRRAETLLRDGTQSMAEIGYRLGYGDTANFSRACRRWFGASPSILRQRLRENGMK